MRQHRILCKAYFDSIHDSGRSVNDEWPEYWNHARSPSDSKLPEYLQLGPLSTLDALDQNNATSSTGVRASSQNDGLHVDAPREPGINRAALAASADRIYWTYLASSAEKEIYLPPSLRILAPLAYNADGTLRNHLDPVIEAEAPDRFSDQDNYVFEALEQDAFPRFLRSHGFGNILPVAALYRLLLGVATIFVGLAVGFSFIFLDVQPKAIRFTVSVTSTPCLNTTSLKIHQLPSYLFHLLLV